MPLFEMKDSVVVPVERTTFHQAGVLERTHLQAVLRDRIDVVVRDVLVVAEEFGDFQDANRRIDLLGLDRRGRLVVIELKRTEDGGHMELQALRYAAMVRTMTLSRLAEVYERHLELNPPADGRDLDARERLVEWLDDDEEPTLATEVAIVLVSADFGREITGTVLWLNEYGLDIRCVKLQPYVLDGHLLLDVEQVIPLPEAAQYQVQIREKQEAKRATTSSTWNHDLTKYVVTDSRGQTTAPLAKRRAILRLAHALVDAGVPASRVAEALPTRKVRHLPGASGEDDVVRELVTAHPSITTPQRWFTEAPLVADDGLYVVTKMFGSDSEVVLTALASLAPAGPLGFAAHEEA